MKSIMMSIRPQWVAKIFNGEKTIEVRKRFPKDYVGWVYIYVTKEKPYLANASELFTGRYACISNDEVSYEEHNLNGKVAARFWCDKVGNIEYQGFGGFAINMPSHIYTSFVDKFYSLGDLLWATRLSYDKLHGYLQCKNGYAIHITKLEIFDEPKELSEFWICTEKQCVFSHCHKYMHCRKYLTKAPQNYMFIEGEK